MYRVAYTSGKQQARLLDGKPYEINDAKKNSWPLSSCIPRYTAPASRSCTLMKCGCLLQDCGAVALFDVAMPAA